MYVYRINNLEYFSTEMVSEIKLASWLRKQGFLAEPTELKKVKLNIFKKQGIKNGEREGQLEEKPAGSVEVALFCRSRNYEEFKQELASVLDEVPLAFRSFIDNYSYEQSHSSGYDEILSTARDLICQLVPAIEKYRREICSNYATK